MLLFAQNLGIYLYFYQNIYKAIDTRICGKKAADNNYFFLSDDTIPRLKVAFFVTD